jgi:hypothetical protein
MTTFNLTCEAVETTLHEYFDESLEPWLRASIEEHLAECARCSGFARKLRNIASEAAALPSLLPDTEVWPGIAGRIGAPAILSEPVERSVPLTLTAEPEIPPSEASHPISERSMAPSERPFLTSDSAAPPSEPPVVTSEAASPASEPPVVTSTARRSEPLVLISRAALLTEQLWRPTYGPVTPVSELIFPSGRARAPDIEPPTILRRREFHWTRGRIGLVAAALVLMAAGTMFLLPATWKASVRTPPVASESGAPKLSSRKKGSAEPGNRGRSPGREPVESNSPTSPSVAGALGPALTASATPAPPVTSSPEDVVYDKEINVLQKIVGRQKAGLAPSTVAVIEKNLGSLDTAIAQIRAALKTHPESSVLDAQASRALEMKVELLRRTAMLRSST